MTTTVAVKEIRVMLEIVARLLDLHIKEVQIHVDLLKRARIHLLEAIGVLTEEQEEADT